ncbi:MAG: Uma2 family endonuclease [Limnothrix sp.]
MVTTPLKPLSLEEFLALPETKPAQEYFNGKISPKPMPKGKHSFIQTQLATKINMYLSQQQLGWVFSELRCTFGDRLC